ncbi:MAG: hypothetical protein JEY97_01440 [Bacteroidales bacterium]|nr:hypothetical protein [Bacteroidales bacterium]
MDFVIFVPELPFRVTNSRFLRNYSEKHTLAPIRANFVSLASLRPYGPMRANYVSFASLHKLSGFQIV